MSIGKAGNMSIKYMYIYIKAGHYIDISKIYIYIKGGNSRAHLLMHRDWNLTGRRGSE